MAVDSEFVVVGSKGLAPKVTIVGYDHNARDPSDEKTIGEFLDGSLHPGDALRLECGSGPYQLGAGVAYGRLGPTIDLLASRGIDVQFNDDTESVRQIHRTLNAWNAYCANGYVAVPAYFRWRQARHTSLVERFNRRREETMAEDLAALTARETKTCQIVGTGHLFSGGMQAALDGRQTPYVAMVPVTTARRNGIVIRGNLSIHPNTG